MRPTKIFTKGNVIKIKALADHGFGAIQIAHAIGSTPGGVRAMCCKIKIKLRRTKGFGGSAKPCIIFDVSEASFFVRPMSAYDPKRTSATIKGKSELVQTTSALPPKADIHCDSRNVSFGP
jgi:hypothetical protein